MQICVALVCTGFKRYLSTTDSIENSTDTSKIRSQRHHCSLPYSFFSHVYVSNTIVLTEENKEAMNSVISNAQPHMPFDVDPQRKVLKYISAILNGLFFDMDTDTCYCCYCTLMLK